MRRAIRGHSSRDGQGHYDVNHGFTGSELCNTIVAARMKMDIKTARCQVNGGGETTVTGSQNSYCIQCRGGHGIYLIHFLEL